MTSKNQQQRNTESRDDDLPREEDNAYTHSDIVNRPTGQDFWSIYIVENCSV